MLFPLRADASPAADDIVVVAVKGEVKLISGGTSQEARAGSTLALPAAIHTGHDGSIDLRQGDTTIGVGPDTRLDFPAPTPGGAEIERVVQPLGNAYYNVGPRGNRRLRVETPYLVAVIKGTQFNVAVTSDTSTISLHEGRLEILATESGIASVELNAGEIAIRQSGEKTIRVLELKKGAASSAASIVGRSDETTAAPMPKGRGDSVPVIPGNNPTTTEPVDEVVDPVNPGLPISPVDGDVKVDVADVIDIGIDHGVGAVDAGVNAAVELGGAGVDAGADVGIDFGAGTVDAGVDVGVDAGGVNVDTSVDTGVDLGAGTVDAAVDAGVDIGGTGVDASVDTSVDAGAGTVDAGIDAEVAGTDVGVDVGVDLGGGDAGLDVGVDLLGTDIDLGLGGDVPAAGGTDAPQNDGPGGLLGGILGRPRL